MLVSMCDLSNVNRFVVKDVLSERLSTTYNRRHDQSNENKQ